MREKDRELRRRRQRRQKRLKQRRREARTRLKVERRKPTKRASKSAAESRLSVPEATKKKTSEPEEVEKKAAAKKKAPAKKTAPKKAGGKEEGPGQENSQEGCHQEDHSKESRAQEAGGKEGCSKKEGSGQENGQKGCYQEDDSEKNRGQEEDRQKVDFLPTSCLWDPVEPRFSDHRSQETPNDRLPHSRGRRPRDLPGHHRRAYAPEQSDRADCVGELRQPGGVGGHRQCHDEQVCRGLSGAPILWGLRVCRRRRAAGDRSGPGRCSGPSTSMSNRTAAPRPTWRSISPCSSRGTRSWGWIWPVVVT